MLLTFYGDDFTGSTDAMEALALGGVRTALFVGSPTDADLKQHPDVQAVGIAGVSRTLSPVAMQDHLPGAFEALARLRAPILHYKVCSTLDSSPTVGSIGRAIDIGMQTTGAPWTPLVFGAPVLGRYVAFANLFARSGLDTAPFRLDRHPTMSRHPVTPMSESDIRLHLGKQTEKVIVDFDLSDLDRDPADVDTAFDELLERDPNVVLFDTTRNAHLRTIGRLLWEHARPDRPLFAVGSSGIEYALSMQWAAAGIAAPLAEEPQPGEVDRIAVVSGSLSPVTAKQIDAALAMGFAAVPADTAALADADRRDGEVARCVNTAAQHISAGRSVVVHIGQGPDDPRIAAARAVLDRQGGASGPVLGGALGRILRGIASTTGLPRLAVTGGDTSGFVAEALGVRSLTFAGRLAPGSPLCRVTSTDPDIDGLQIVFKGGQVGRPDFFASVLAGRPNRPVAVATQE